MTNPLASLLFGVNNPQQKTVADTLAMPDPQAQNPGVIDTGQTPPVMMQPHHSGVQNVLGFLGDFLMSRLHMGTPYHDSRENEKLNAARIADEQSGDTTYTRTGALNPAWAAQLQNRAIDNNRLAASVASTTELRDARIAAEKEKERIRQRGVLGNFIEGLARRPEKERAETYTNLLPKFKQLYPEGTAELPNDYNPIALDAFADSLVPVGTQRAQRLTELRDANNAQLGKDRIGATIQGQQLNHTDRQAGIAAANSRAAGHDATSRANTQARINAGPVVSTTNSSGDIVMPDGTIKKYSGTKTTTKGRAGTAKQPTISGW